MSRDVDSAIRLEIKGLRKAQISAGRRRSGDFIYAVYTNTVAGRPPAEAI